MAWKWRAVLFLSFVFISFVFGIYVIDRLDWKQKPIHVFNQSPFAISVVYDRWNMDQNKHEIYPISGLENILPGTAAHGFFLENSVLLEFCSEILVFRSGDSKALQTFPCDMGDFQFKDL